MIVKFTTLLLTFIASQLVAEGQHTYRLDTGKSTLRWNSGEVGHHFGNIQFSSGNLLFSKDGKPVSGTFVIDMKTIKSMDNKDEAKNLQTDAGMKKPDFFDVPNYPEATMVVSEIIKLPNSAYHRVRGNLTIKGTQHLIEFVAAIQQSDKEVNIRADIDLLRRWWGIDYKPKTNSLDFLSGVGPKSPTDQMYIAIQLVLVK